MNTHPDGPIVETDQTRAAEALAEQDESEAEPKVDLEPLRVDLELPGVESVFIPPDPALRLAPLYAALAQAQGAFPEIPKDRVATVRPQTGQTWEFKYSDLSDLINATRPALTGNGLAVFQIPSDDLKNCIPTLAHSTGLTLVGSYPVRHKDGRMHPGQDWAISFAFARRYGMSALLGIASEETIEGDKTTTTTDNFESKDRDGILSVRGAKVTDGATKAEKARIFASAIEDQIGEAKTEAGLPGCCERNQRVFELFRAPFLGA